MILVVTGGRAHPPFRPLFEKKFLRDICKAYLPYNPVTDLYHGAEQGAGTSAALWAARAGFKVKAFPADWEKYGKRAGIIRNHDMWNAALRTEDILLLVAFPGGRGTGHMVNHVKEEGGNILMYGDPIPDYYRLIPF